MTGAAGVDPLYVYANLSRQQAEERLRANRAIDGDFLIRELDASKKEYNLVVVYNGNPTHHALRPGPDGSFTVNKQPCNGAQTIADVIDYFSRPVRGWPVLLKTGIARDPEPEPKASVNVATRDVPAPTPVTPSAAPSWVKRREPSPEPPKSTRLAVARRPSAVSPEIIEQARKKAEQDAARIDKLLAAEEAAREQEKAARKESVRAERAKLLREHRAAQEEAFSGFGNDELAQPMDERRRAAYEASAARAFDEHEAALALLKANVADMTRVTLVEQDPNNPSYLWRSCTKQQSTEYLAGKPDGTFLMRKTSPYIKHSYLLDIVFKGKRTTHAVALDDGTCTLNSRTVGHCTTIDDVITRLKQPLKNWPVQLQDPVVDPTKCRPRVPGAPSPETNPHKPSYLNAETPRAVVAKLLEDEPDGTFHVRPQLGAGNRDAYLLCVRFRDQLTQHSIERSRDGTYAVNGKPMGQKRTLDGLIEYLRVPNKNWPVQLTTAVRPAGVNAPIPHGYNAKMSEEIRRDNSQICNKVAVTTATLAAAEARLVDDPDDADIPPPSAETRAALMDLDIRTARMALSECERALAKKKAALSELRLYAKAGTELPGRMVEVDPNNPSYLWHISVAEAKAKLEGKADGTFLVRSSNVKADVYLLALVYNAKVTVHKVALNDRHVFTVNDKPMGGKTTLDGVITYLSTGQRASWPVVLQRPIRNPTKPAPEAEAVRVAAADVCAAEVAVESARLTMTMVNPDARGFRSRAPPGSAKMDTRAVSFRQTRTVLSQLEDELHEAYTSVLQTSVPMLNRDHSDVLYAVMSEKLATEIRNTDAAKHDRLKELYMLAVQLRQARAVHEQLQRAEKAMESNPTDEVRDLMATMTIKVAAMDKATAVAADVVKSLQKRKMSLVSGMSGGGGDSKAKAKDDGTELDRISKQLTAAINAHAVKEQAANELRVIRSDALLVYFFNQMSLTTRAVLQQLHDVYHRRLNTAPTTPDIVVTDGVSTAAGFIPLPAMSARSIIGQLFSSGALEDASAHNQLATTLSNNMARVMAYRYQDQIRLLTAFDAKQFAQWFALPLVLGLVRELPRPTLLHVGLAALRNVTFEDTEPGSDRPLTVGANGVKPGSPAHTAGLRPGDAIVGVAGTPCRTVEALMARLDDVTASGGGKGGGGGGAAHEVSVTVAALESAVPSDPTSVAAFLIRMMETPPTRTPTPTQAPRAGAVTSFDGGSAPVASAEPASRTFGVVETSFQAVHAAELVGGPLWLETFAAHARPADVVLKSGTSIIEGETLKFFHSPGDTDISTFGFRRATPSMPSLYRTTLAEFRRLGWSHARPSTGPPSFASTAMVHGRATFRSALELPNGLSSEPLWNPVETIALAKTAEAEELALEVLRLKSQVHHLNSVNGHLQEKLAATVGAPLPVTFRSALHKRKSST
eukprot:m.56882 g.56882  ORF g.56882 m.56882 type:complete len:1426 (+) comp7706_c0_seq1:172-4449(+)